MKNFRPLYFLIHLFFLGLVFQGCKKPCDDPDTDSVNALYFEFQQGGDNGFSQEELQSMYIIRYVPLPPEIEMFIGDTLYFNGNFYESSPNRVRISNQHPWNNREQPYWVDYNYIFKTADTTYADTIQNISILGEYTGDEKCSYTNLRKTYVFRGDSLDFTGSTSPKLITK